MCMSPNSGCFKAVPAASRAIAPSSPRYSGWADTESPSEQESVHDTPRKRTEKRRHTILYQSQDAGDGYRQQGPPQFGHPFHAPYQSYPYQGYAYPLDYQSTTFHQPAWHHTVAPTNGTSSTNSSGPFYTAGTLM